MMRRLLVGCSRRSFSSRKHARRSSQTPRPSEPPLLQDPERMIQLLGQKADTFRFPLRSGRLGGPRRLSDAPDSWPVLSREAAFEGAYAYLHSRFRRAASAQQRTSNPILATHAGPGMGKSFFCDRLSAFPEADLKRYAEPLGQDFVEHLRSTVRVQVTFNGGGRVLPEEAKEPEVYFALRVLHSHFCDYSFPWEDFALLFRPVFGPNLGLRQALRMVQWDAMQQQPSRKSVPILLCVDELRKLEDDRAISVILKSIIARLDDDNQFSALITALNQENLKQENTPGRVIQWLPLKPIDGQALLRAVDGEVAGAVRDLVRPVELEALLALCGGHPRTLENLIKMLRGITSRPLMHSFIDDLATTLPHISHWVDSLPKDELLSLLRPVVLAEAVPVGGSPFSEDFQAKQRARNGPVTYGQLIEAGFYSNSLGTKTECVPTMVPLRLRQLVSLRRFRPDLALLRRLLALEVESRSFQQYEWWHATWEALRRQLAPFDTLSLAEAYPGARYCPELWRPHEYELQGWNLLADGTPVPTGRHLPGSTFQMQPGSVLVAGDGNKGFDIAMPVQRVGHGAQGKQRLCVINLELKSSFSKNKAYISRSELKEKVDLTLKQYAPHVKGVKRPLAEEDIVFVLLGMRPLSQCLREAFPGTLSDEQDVEPRAESGQAPSQHSDWRRRVLVLDIDAIKALYGPTLSHALLFWKQLSPPNPFG